MGRLYTALVFLIFAMCAGADETQPHSCQQINCDDMSNYEKYIECMTVRQKRDVSCQNNNNNVVVTDDDYDSDCGDCDCQACSSNSCQSSCQQQQQQQNCCSQCCNVINQCSTNTCCHKTCHANCKNNACRSSCKKTCSDFIKKEPPAKQISVTNHITNHTTTVIQPKPHNITTVIHLNNYVNNTNLINVPVSVNTTNYHNISLAAPVENINDSGKETNGSSKTDDCCVVIGPRQCQRTQTFPFLRCFHIRSKECGQICKSPYMHAEQHEICSSSPPQQPSSDPNAPQQPQPCQRETLYIPQPRPRCAYQPSWPYVSCGQPQRGYESCEGCYSHYTRPDQLTRCSPFCYDDGFNLGPLYRQGPFYRPGLAHVPSCYQIGCCNAAGGLGGYGGGYGGGGYGVNYPPPPPPPPPYGGYGGQYDNFVPYGGGYAPAPPQEAYVYPNFGYFGTLPAGALGYPPLSYEYPQYGNSTASANNNSNNNVYPGNPFGVQFGTPVWNVDGPILNYPYPIVYGVPPNYNLSNDGLIEANVQLPRSTRFAEIKIVPRKEGSAGGDKEEDDGTTTVTTLT